MTRRTNLSDETPLRREEDAAATARPARERPAMSLPRTMKEDRVPFSRVSRGFLSESFLRRVIDASAAFGLVLYAAAATVSIALSQIGVGIAAAALLVRLVLDRGRGWRRTALDLPVAAFLVAELVGVIFSQHFARSAKLFREEWIVLFYFVFSQSLRDRREASRLFDLFMAAGAITSVYAIWQHAAGWDALRDRPLEPVEFGFMATGFFGHHLTFGGAILMVAVIGLATAIAPVGWGRRAFYGTVGLLGSAAVAWSYARTAWIGLLAGVLVALAFRGRRVLLAGAAALAVLAAGAVLIEPSLAVRGAALVNAGDPASSARVRLWRTAVRIWQDHPITGAGLGSFKTHFEEYKVPGEYFARGHPHNDFLNILVGSGILGLVAFLALVAVLFHRALTTRARAPASMSAERAILSAAVAALVAFLVAGLGQCYLTDEETAMIFWFTVACAMVVAREAEVRTRAEGLPGGRL